MVVQFIFAPLVQQYRKIYAQGEILDDTTLMKKTIEIGQAVFWSRSRQEVWHKGATSGDFIAVHSITTDCDRDVVILKVSLVGDGICHTGASSCFISESGQDQVVELKI